MMRMTSNHMNLVLIHQEHPCRMQWQYPSLEEILAQHLRMAHKSPRIKHLHLQRQFLGLQDLQQEFCSNQQIEIRKSSLN